MSDWETTNAEEVNEYVKKNGVSGINEFFRNQLERSEKEGVNIGITGDSGAGKSSFINMFRGLNDDDDGAASVDVNECTTEPKSYDHPKYPNVKFWDLPGIGTPNYPDLETYRQKVQLDKYHTFLILASNRFTEYDNTLAREIKKQGKSFFFIRTKIDVDVQAEMRKKSFSEAAVLQKIRRNCKENLVDKPGEPISNEDFVFLISNHHPDKWDFGRLTKAILDALPRYKREALTLSLDNLTVLSKGILKRKVAIFKGRMFLAAGISAGVAVVPVPGVSYAVDALLVFNEVRAYITQLGVPVEGSRIFEAVSITTQNAIVTTQTRFCSIARILALFGKEVATGLAVEEASRFIPILGPVIASSLSFACTIFFLQSCLKEIEEVALAVLKEAKHQSVNSFECE